MGKARLLSFFFVLALSAAAVAATPKPCVTSVDACVDPGTSVKASSVPLTVPDAETSSLAPMPGNQKKLPVKTPVTGQPSDLNAHDGELFEQPPKPKVSADPFGSDDSQRLHVNPPQ